MEDSWSEPDEPSEGDAWDQLASGSGQEPETGGLDAYRAALTLAPRDRLDAMLQGLELEVRRTMTAVEVAGLIAERLGEPGQAAATLGGLAQGPRLVLTLFALTESRAWPLPGLSHALTCLGVDPEPAIEALQIRGLVAIQRGLRKAVVPGTNESDGGDPLAQAVVIAHPAVVASARTVLPEGKALPTATSVRQIRQADGLEPLLRLAVVWQRVAESPLRQTQNGALYKRDRERLDDDPAIAGPISDALEPLPDMPALWLSLAGGIGMLVSERGSDRVAAAAPEFWSENAYHLPQMMTGRWLSLWDWHEQGGMQRDGAEVLLALPFTRLPVLLWLGTLSPDDWVATEDFAEFLRGFDARWDRPAFQWPSTLAEIRPGRPTPKRPKARPADEPTGPGALEAMLLGVAYQLGLIRAAEELGTNRRVVQLAPLGRYLLGLGAPPEPAPVVEHFLFVQPSFEVIAYRQGLNPAIIGRFSRFTRISQVGAAVTLTLTAESVYRGLEGGMKTDQMLGALQSHSPRPLPAGVAEAIRDWGGRRERVTYHGAATLVEFVTPEDLDRVLRDWPESADRPAPVRVTDRLLLIEDERTIPFQRFRLTGSRNYRNPAEACVEVGADGVSLTLDPARSDLLVDAELARFADERTPVNVVPATLSVSPAAPQPRRRFVVSAASLARGMTYGLTAASLAQWFARRSGGPLPPAVRLLMAAGAGKGSGFTAGRRLVLRTPSPDLLDGLLQHPDTRDYVGERLGPDAAIVTEALLPGLRQALATLGLAFEIESV